MAQSDERYNPDALIVRVKKDRNSRKDKGRAPRPIHVKTLIRDALRCDAFWETTAETRAGFKVSEATLRAVLIELAEYHGADGRMYPSNARLSHDLRISERQITTARRCLEACGVIVLTVRGGKRVGTKTGTRYAAVTNVYRLNSDMLTKYREAYLRQQQAIKRAQTEDHPPETISPQPKGFLIQNNTPTTTTVNSGGGVVSDSDLKADRQKHNEAGPPLLPKAGQVRKASRPPVRHKQEKPTRYRYTQQQVIAALVAAGSSPERARVWLKYANPDRKTGLYAPRYAFDDLKTDAAEWAARDKAAAEWAEMTYAEMGKHAEKYGLTIVRDYVQLDGNLWRPKNSNERGKRTIRGR